MLIPTCFLLHNKRISCIGFQGFLCRISSASVGFYRSVVFLVILDTCKSCIKTSCFGAIHEGYPHIFSVFDPLPSCPHLSTFVWPLPPVRVDTNFEYTEFFIKNVTPNIHLHHLSPYTNTKKVSCKVRYLLTTLIQDENREIKNIYLKISSGNKKKTVFVLRNLYTILYEDINVLS